jgi:hypothetical protein
MTTCPDHDKNTIIMVFAAIDELHLFSFTGQVGIYVDEI